MLNFFTNGYTLGGKFQITFIIIILWKYFIKKL